MPLSRRSAERAQDDASCRVGDRRQLQLAATMGASRPTTSSTTTSRTRCSPSCGPSRRRAPRTSSSWAPGYWDHYAEQATRDEPQLDPGRSRGGIHELELAIDVMDAVFNDKDEIHPGQRPEHAAACCRASPRTSWSRSTAARRRLDRAAAGAAAAPARARADRGARRVPVPRRPTPPGRATAATPSARWLRTRWCARCRGPRSCTPSSPRPIARTCPRGWRHRGSPTQPATGSTTWRSARSPSTRASCCPTRASRCRSRRCCCAATARRC